MRFKEIFKKNKKIILIIAIIIITVISSLIGVNMKKDVTSENKGNNKKQQEKVEVKENTNKNVIKEQIVDGIKVSDVKVEIIDGLTTFTAKATNTTETPIYFKGVDINVVGDINVTLGVHGFTVINPGETLDLINYSDVDLEKATEVTYSILY